MATELPLPGPARGGEAGNVFLHFFGLCHILYAYWNLAVPRTFWFYDNAAFMQSAEKQLWLLLGLKSSSQRKIDLGGKPRCSFVEISALGHRIRCL
jgi:hypothetical protein